MSLLSEMTVGPAGIRGQNRGVRPNRTTGEGIKEVQRVDRVRTPPSGLHAAELVVARAEAGGSAVDASHGENPFQHAGTPWPLGVRWIEAEKAFNFALFSRHATGVTLLFYKEKDPAKTVVEFRLQFPQHKTADIWHCRIPQEQLQGSTLYAYRIEGPDEPQHGHRFDCEKILLDPYAPSVFFPPNFSRGACAKPGRTDGQAPLGRLPSTRAKPAEEHGPRNPGSEVIIYELHVKGFTARSNSGVTANKRGTFAGLTEKIPYLRDLGVTVVELLPVQQFDPQEGNYWGYMTLHFFSPHQQYAAGKEVFEEFREMVKAFHSAGIEIWLDVVYNHTSEGDQNGPTYSFRGIDNQSYYLLTGDGRNYVNDTGCGNTVRTGHAAGRVLVLESLRFWAREMGVDGFRFDLASIFSRAADGTMGLHEASLVSEISLLARVLNIRVVAEAWDISSYQLGQGFPGVAWLQWNGRFRDDVRSFVKGDADRVGALMQRLYGSDDLFPDALQATRRPHQSINFVTAHDGFCLYDLVAYNQKHNEGNGFNNTDGCDHNLSWNCGWEGDEQAPAAVLALRRRQVKNFCALLLLSNGVPMIVAGDEFLNTQGGNNNPFNQDNEITWLDWSLLEKNRDVHRFFKRMIEFRKAHQSIGRPVFWREDVRWYGPEGPVDFGPDSRSVAYVLHGQSVGDDDLCVMINAHWDDREFKLQEGEPGEWCRVVDTFQSSPEDIFEHGCEPMLERSSYLVHGRSVVVLRRIRTESRDPGIARS